MHFHVIVKVFDVNTMLTLNIPGFIALDVVTCALFPLAKSFFFGNGVFRFIIVQKWHLPQA